jgi:hypothetical protein
MSRPALIGLTGKARSGKDTVGNFILGAVGGYTYAFADPIRAMLRGFGIDMSDPYWQANKETVIPSLGVSPRHLMQTLGTEWGRKLVNPDVWLILAKQKLLKNGPGMIVTDVRFENEAKWIRDAGGLLIHIERPDSQPVQTHESEMGILMGSEDYKLFNRGTLAELQASVHRLLRVD